MLDYPIVKFLRKLAVLTAGWALITVGAVLIPLPGPGIPVLAAGVYVLSLKSARARLLLLRLKSRLRSTYPDLWPALERFKSMVRRRLAAPGGPKQ